MTHTRFAELFQSSLGSLPLFALQAAAAVGMLGAMLVLTRKRGLAIAHREAYLGLIMGLAIYVIAWFVSGSMKGPVKLNLSTDLLLLSGLLGGGPGGLACYLLHALARYQFSGVERLLGSMVDTAIPVLAGLLLRRWCYPALLAGFRWRILLYIWLGRVVATYLGLLLALQVTPVAADLVEQFVVLRLLVLPLSLGILYLALQMVALDAQIDRQRTREYDLSHTDALTGLPNRKALGVYLADLHASGVRSVGCLAVLELGNLRDFLLRYGLQNGSRLWGRVNDIEHAMPVMQAIRRYQPRVFQYGDFSLAIVLRGAHLADLEHSGEVEAFLQQLSQDMSADWHSFSPVFRCAVVELDNDYQQGEDGLPYRNITLALNAHDAGVAYFNDLLRRDAVLDGYIELALDAWLADPASMPLAYQPKVRLQDGQLAGGEALLRLHDAFGQPVAAMRAISLFRQRGRLAEFEWVSLFAVVGVLPQILSRFPGCCISVNVSAESLCKADFGLQVNMLLQQHNVPGSALCLEVVEWSDVLQMPQVEQNMALLAQAGVCLSLDDFGVGYSTLMLLTQFAFAEVKLEQSLIATIDNRKSRSFIALAVEVAHRSGARVVAEGTETPHDLARVRELGVDLAQGYLFSPAMPLQQFLHFPLRQPLSQAST
ncbi:MAG: EAL domain-containing protein [Vogesella sp.]|uniref:EAL domain-containing protein n=1 Tax=Vogesella sp. TaxID=1904252 RepID=UPI003F362673